MLKISQSISFEDFLLAKELVKDSDILIFKTNYQYPLERKKWYSLVNVLSEDLKNEINKFNRWQDRHNFLFGKLLLYMGYLILEDKTLDFEKYKSLAYHKPFIEGAKIDFNISHSDRTVVCAISESNTIGIDVERIKEMDISNFNSILHENEYFKIRQNKNGIREFYKFWTRKEAFTKATGKGLTIPLCNLDTTEDWIIEKRRKFYLKSKIMKDCYYSLAYDKKDSDIILIEVRF